MNESSRSTGPATPRVWIIAPFPPPFGGMSVQARHLKTKLMGEGIDAEMIPTNPALPSLLAFLQRIPALRTIFREAQYLVSLGRVVRNPCVVHHLCASYLFFFLHSAPLLLLGRWPARRVILNYRGGQAANFLRQWGWAAIPLLRGADEIVVPSVFLQRVFQGFGLTATLLPNLADTELFPFIERERFAPRLFVSRNLEPMYDVECVLRAFRTIQSKVPQAVLGIAGDGSEADRLQGLVREFGLRDVTFYGAVRNEELPFLYGQYDIYVNASRVDNFPGALVEAACSGLPIVSTRAGGIPEMITDRKNGLLCNVGDSEALARSVLEVVDDPELGRDLARSARSWAEQFSWQNVYPQLMRCYGFGAKNTIPPIAADRIPVH